jgi:uridine kinase
MPDVPFLAIIAGGSGTGKSTLAEALVARHPDWALVQVDDYLKTIPLVPRRQERRNWDHPDAVEFDVLLRDLQALRRGEPVTRLINRRDLPGRPWCSKTVRPGPVILLEGYLALWHEDIRAMAGCTFFLDAAEDVRLERRRWKKDPDYVERFLLPMHAAHVEPTRQHALVAFPTDAVDPKLLADEVEFLLLACL